MTEKLYGSYRKWRTDTCSAPEGIVVGSDLNQEWLLPWWWENYRHHNSYPVAFVDFGMSDEMRKWCEERGELIRLYVADSFVSEKQEMDASLVSAMEIGGGTDFWSSRSAWFKKPLACLQSPFLKSIWLDLDCQIQGPLKPLFDLCNDDLAIAIDMLFLSSPAPVYNSGVIAFRQGLKVIEEWANQSFERNNQLRGDQDVLMEIIEQNKTPIVEIPQIYNWSRTGDENPDAVVLHWHGPQGKTIIAHQIAQSNLASLGLSST